MASGIINPNVPSCNLNCELTPGDGSIEIQQIHLDCKLASGDVSIKIQMIRNDNQFTDTMNIKLDPEKSTEASIPLRLGRHEIRYTYIAVGAFVAYLIFETVSILLDHWFH
jgi:hypothetical protein